MTHNCHGNIFLLTAKSISRRQNQFHHGKINFATAQSISQYGKINFTHGRINFTHDIIIFTHGKINFTKAKSFWQACSRDISSQSAMGVNPTERSSSWFHDSTGVFYSTKISENSGSKLNGTESFRKLVSKILVNLSRLSFLPKFGNSGIFLFHLAFLPGMNRPQFF